MGTINYGTSDYITMGIKPYDRSGFENDPDFKAEYEEYGQGRDMYEFIEETISMYYEDDYDNAMSILRKYGYEDGGRGYYHIKLEYGYYEGMYIDIENNYGVCYDSYKDKREAQKEITAIRAMFRELAGIGFSACYPGWGTHYEDYKGTIKKIDEAIRDMRDEARSIPTWLWLEREQYC